MSNQNGEKISETANPISIRSKIMLPKIPVFLRWIWPLWDSTIFKFTAILFISNFYYYIEVNDVRCLLSNFTVFLT